MPNTLNCERTLNGNADAFRDMIKQFAYFSGLRTCKCKSSFKKSSIKFRDGTEKPVYLCATCGSRYYQKQSCSFILAATKHPGVASTVMDGIASIIENDPGRRAVLAPNCNPRFLKGAEEFTYINFDELSFNYIVILDAEEMKKVSQWKRILQKFLLSLKYHRAIAILFDGEFSRDARELADVEVWQDDDGQVACSGEIIL